MSQSDAAFLRELAGAMWEPRWSDGVDTDRLRAIAVRLEQGAAEPVCGLPGHTLCVGDTHDVVPVTEPPPAYTGAAAMFAQAVQDLVAEFGGFDQGVEVDSLTWLRQRLETTAPVAGPVVPHVIGEARARQHAARLLREGHAEDCTGGETCYIGCECFCHVAAPVAGPLRKADQALEAIQIRCREGDSRSDWLPVIDRLATEARAALADPKPPTPESGGA